MGAADEAGSWTEHTHSDGRRYYYNRVTKQSSWDKPDALKSPEERMNNTVWKEYKAADGRDYYFNTVTKQSVWEMPIELKRLRGLMKEDSSEDEKEPEKEEAPQWSTQEERRNAFKDLLEEKGVKSTMKWEEAIKQIQEDPRFNALPSAGERKQFFAEWLTQTKKREKEEERDKKKRAKDDYLAALTEWKDLKVNSRYRDAAEALMDKEFWPLIDEDERDELFQDFMDEHEKKTKEERRKKRKEFVEKVKKVYDEKSEITVTSRWREVQDLLRDNESFRWLSKLEALTSWEEWVLDQEKKEIEEKRKVKYRQERLNRDACRDLLREQQIKGRINMTTHWSSVAKKIVDDPRYEKLIGQPGSTPHDLFDDLIDELNEKYKEDRAKIKKMAKAKGLIVTSSSTYEWFHEQLKAEEGYVDIPEEHRKMMFESLVGKAKEQDEDMEKNAKKNRGKFVELLQKTRDITATSTYKEAEKLLGSSAAWTAVDEQTRRQCFDIFVDQLKIQSAGKKEEDAGSDDSDADDERPKKKGKTSKAASAKEKTKKKKDADEEPPAKSSKKPAKKREREEEDEDDDGDKKKKHKSRR
mmetsp:Transcript_66980/g.160456  ORF Transcript_66980/g.160456 Transcript_66980/m.160456 type:complete len:583 (-) Transcript_66980:105-1853(-)|eukprot:CAMPEP_0178439454 /NCGR_PEP_ID=MMETSP0689_2-20121128/36167_1 /TAXON_ID=160604 /ORGANISM="Amphidinium massartii, Strain CS-259" /LENGTH=582 /DNA_ID=CAMNT_0020061989 /DNA_START=38 /DNA_END=1786 /DNA_ORIENTATION=+